LKLAKVVHQKCGAHFSKDETFPHYSENVFGNDARDLLPFGRTKLAHRSLPTKANRARKQM
jgi:hypothetical protein